MNCHLTLTKRTGTGKGAARQLRREGKVPAVLYGKGDTISLTLDPVEFNKVLRVKQQGYVLITLAEANKKSASQHNVILRDLQYDPISGEVLHADFFEVRMDQPIQVTIPIVIAGSTPVGVILGGSRSQLNCLRISLRLRARTAYSLWTFMSAKSKDFLIYPSITWMGHTFLSHTLNHWVLIPGKDMQQAYMVTSTSTSSDNSVWLSVLSSTGINSWLKTS